MASNKKGNIQPEFGHKYTLKIGITESESPACPECGELLKTRPKGSKKCKACGIKMVVRTRPVDGLKVLLSEKQVKQINDEKEMVAITKREWWPTAEKMNKAKQSLAKEWGKEPSDFDARWRVLSDDCASQLKFGNWDEYRMMRYYMTDILINEGKFQQAFVPCLEVIVLDINHLARMLGHNQKLIESFGVPFDLVEPSSPNRYMVSCLIQIVEDQGAKIEDIKPEFVQYASKYSRLWNQGIQPDEAWKAFLEEIKQVRTVRSLRRGH